MKHGLNVLALTCWMAGAAFASETGPQVLPPEQWETIEGGDLFLSVDRDTQMMTVTRVTPGNYGSTEAYAVKVTTAVVRNTDVTASLPKGALTNVNRPLGDGEKQPLPTQFPTGTAQLGATTTTSPLVTGPMITTNAAPMIPAKTANGPTMVPDSGYNIHYVDPAKSSNTMGCIGVQSTAGMAQLLTTLKTDNATYASPSDAKQTVTVSSYTNGTPPPASTFTAVEKKPVVTPAPVPAPAPTPAPATSAPTTSWWKFW